MINSLQTINHRINLDDIHDTPPRLYSQLREENIDTFHTAEER